MPFERRVMKPEFFLHSATLQTYFITCVRNRWKKKHLDKHLDAIELEDEQLRDFAKSVEALIMDADFSRLVETTFGQISPACKKVLTMHMNDYSMEEIARAMGWASADVAKSRKCDCAKKYKKYLEKHPELLELVKEQLYG